jgi:hypothetical protein
MRPASAEKRFIHRAPVDAEVLGVLNHCVRAIVTCGRTMLNIRGSNFFLGVSFRSYRERWHSFGNDLSPVWRAQGKPTRAPGLSSAFCAGEELLESARELLPGLHVRAR